MTTTSSVRMKLGPVEFECTASEEFLRDELPALMAGMAQLYKEHFTDSEVQGEPRATAGKNSHGGSSANGVTPALVELTTTSIAAKLKVKNRSRSSVSGCHTLKPIGEDHVYENRTDRAHARSTDLFPPELSQEP